MISQTRAGVTTWFHNVHNGPTNVSHLTNSSGAVVQKYGFDAFGNLTLQTGSTTNNYRFQTKELHPQSNLVYFGARWYNPVVGRWLTPDPLGIIDGPNVYVYLNNNPINLLDPWGLCGGKGLREVPKWAKWLWRLFEFIKRMSKNLREGYETTHPSYENLGPKSISDLADEVGSKLGDSSLEQVQKNTGSE